MASEVENKPSTEPAWELEYPIPELRVRLERQIALLEQELAEPTAKATLGKEVLRTLQNALSLALQRTASKLRVVVLGDFKRGKSTLINALLGQALAPVDVLPETLAITEFHYGEPTRAFLHLDDGARMPLAIANLKSDRLAPILATLPSPLTRISVEAPVPLLRDLTLVDTPGTGDLRTEFDQQVHRYLARADVIVAVSAADAALSQSEREQLLSAVARHDFSRICIVLNKVDVLSKPDDLRRVADFARQRVADILPGAELYPLSALSEFQRVTGAAPHHEANGATATELFETFRGTIAERMASQAESIVLQRSVYLALQGIDDLESHVARLHTALAQRSETLEHQVAAQARALQNAQAHSQSRRAKLRTAITALGDQAKLWMNEFVDRMANALTSQLLHVSIADVDKDLHFFLNDTLRQGVTHCFEAHSLQLSDIASATFGQEIAMSVDPAKDFEVFIADLVRKTAKPSDLAVIHSTLPLLGSLLPLASEVSFLVGLGSVGLDRARQGTDLREAANRIRAAVPGLKQLVGEVVEHAYRTLATELLERLEQAQAKHLEATHTALNQALLLQQDGNTETSLAQSTLQEVLKTLELHRSELLQLGTRLD